LIDWIIGLKIQNLVNSISWNQQQNLQKTLFQPRSGLCSHDSDPVCYVERVLIRWKSNVCFLIAFWGNQRVNFLDLDVVQLLARLLNHSLVSFLVDNEYKCVVVFNGLDSRFTAQWVLDTGEFVEGIIFAYSSQEILWNSLLDSSLWSSEGCLGPDLCFFGGVFTLLHCSCSCFSRLN